MNSTPTERRLRLYCRLLSLAACVGAVVELWLVEHYEGWQQWMPFGICFVTAASVTLVGLRPTRTVLKMHRRVMLLMLLGSAYGVYSHFSENVSFAREIRASASAAELWDAGLHGGNPLLAAGILAMGAALGLLGAYGADTDNAISDGTTR